MPLISIITINKNNAKGLERTLLSVLNQRDTDFEYLVIDGNSTDGSSDLIVKHAPRLFYWVSEPDTGIYNAMNKGIAKATGKYLLFLNSGDCLADENVIANVKGKLGDHDIVYGDMIIDRQGKKEHATSPPRLEFEEMIRGTLWHPVSFIRKELFQKHGPYKENYQIIADYEFFLRTIYVHHATTLHIPVVVAVFDTTGIGSSPKHMQLHDRERKEAQEALFHKDILQSAMNYSEMKRSKPMIVSQWLAKKPFLLKVARMFYRLAKKLV